ncbi:MAG: hypothetical protein ABUL54_05230 [Dongia sp.]|jgi:hypothetical protein
MTDITTAWAAPGAGPLMGGVPLYPTRDDQAASANDTARRRADGARIRRVAVAPWRVLSLLRYWSVLVASAAGWATLEIAYCPWQLVPQTPQELGIAAFGAVAGATGALVMILHPERPHH